MTTPDQLRPFCPKSYEGDTIWKLRIDEFISWQLLYSLPGLFFQDLITSSPIIPFPTEVDPLTWKLLQGSVIFGSQPRTWFEYVEKDGKPNWDFTSIIGTHNDKQFRPSDLDILVHPSNQPGVRQYLNSFPEVQVHHSLSNCRAMQMTLPTNDISIEFWLNCWPKDNIARHFIAQAPTPQHAIFGLIEKTGIRLVSPFGHSLYFLNGPCWTDIYNFRNSLWNPNNAINWQSRSLTPIGLAKRFIVATGAAPSFMASAGQFCDWHETHKLAKNLASNLTPDQATALLKAYMKAVLYPSALEWRMMSTNYNQVLARTLEQSKLLTLYAACLVQANLANLNTTQDEKFFAYMYEEATGQSMTQQQALQCAAELVAQESIQLRSPKVEPKKMPSPNRVRISLDDSTYKETRAPLFLPLAEFN